LDRETGLPIAAAFVRFSVDGNQRELATNDEGLVTIDNLLEGTELVVLSGAEDYEEERTLLQCCQQREISLTPQKASLTVRVLDRKTNQPIAGAFVRFSIAGQKQKLTTNGEGLVTLPGLRKNSELSVVSDAVGYIGESLVLRCCDQRDVQLTPQTVSQTFRVLDQKTNQPIAGAFVRFSLAGNQKELTTDRRGLVTIDGLQEGTNLVVVSGAPGYGQERIEQNCCNQRDILLNALLGKTGVVRINLRWKGAADLDLHVLDPCQNHIFFKDQNRSATCNGKKGELDLDMNAEISQIDTANAQENIHWKENLPGNYRVIVHYFPHYTNQPNLRSLLEQLLTNGRSRSESNTNRDHGPTDYILTIQIGDTTEVHNGRLEIDGKKEYAFKVD
jgi:hypothetical protein